MRPCLQGCRAGARRLIEKAAGDCKKTRTGVYRPTPPSFMACCNTIPSTRNASMSWDHTALLLFLLAAIALLGSPGPVIVSLVATGRKSGFAGSLRYFLGIQAGLALAAGLSAA